MERLKEWEKEHPRFLKLRDLGKSLQGRPLVAAVLTDPDAPAQDKEHVLITANTVAESDPEQPVFFT